MSRRTSEASKAIRLAWENERQLVREGKGTRDWTREQQQSILDENIGKAYDDNGKAFEGHHMKNAETYPEYQGEAENIEFLTRAEHQDAHGGNFQNSTNGYYDPITHTTVNFGEGKYKPCEIIDLSTPVIITNDNEQGTLCKSSEQTYDNPANGDKSITEDLQEGSPLSSVVKDRAQPKLPKNNAKTKVNVFEKLVHRYQQVNSFLNRHPIIKTIGISAAGIAATKLINRTGSSGHSSSSDGMNNIQMNDSNISSTENAPNDSSDSSLLKKSDEATSECDYPDSRKSPSEHIVSGHPEHFHTKNGVVVKDIEPYPRGGKKDNN